MSAKAIKGERPAPHAEWFQESPGPDRLKAPKVEATSPQKLLNLLLQKRIVQTHGRFQQLCRSAVGKMLWSTSRRKTSNRAPVNTRRDEVR